MLHLYGRMNEEATSVFATHRSGPTAADSALPPLSAAAAESFSSRCCLSHHPTQYLREREREGERGRAEQSAADLGKHRAASGSDDARASDAACSSSSAASSCRSCVCV